jgi:hypothetical protein
MLKHLLIFGSGQLNIKYALIRSFSEGKIGVDSNGRVKEEPYKRCQVPFSERKSREL